MPLRRLLSEPGIPKLRKRARHLRLKGKGHEWSDASRLLSFYQIWLDDLFPKAKFLDALAMVEKAGHKTAMHKARMDWINEGKPRGSIFDDVADDDARPADEAAPREPARIAPIFERAKTTAAAAAAGSGRPATPDREDLFGDEDIYDATPRATAPAATGGGGEPDEDDLDALMAEAEAAPPLRSLFGGGGGKPAGSLFGGPVTAAAAAADGPDEEDLDALMAEQEGSRAPASRPAVSSIFGGGKSTAPPVEEAEDDLDALMAEVEAGGTSSKPLTATEDAAKAPDENGGPKDSFADEEEAMAEMDGLW